MKKFILCSCLSLILLTPLVVYGQTSSDCTNTPSNTLCNPIRFSKDDIGTFAYQVVTTFTAFFALTAVVMVIFSGLRMMTSQGNEEAITVARSSLQWSVLGLILAMFALVIVYAVGTYIGAKDPNAASYVGNNRVLNPLLDTTFLGLLTTLITGFLSVVGLLAFLMIAIGGFRYITSGGNEEQAESGKKTLQWAIMGLVAILLAYVLVQATLTFFGR